MKKLNNCYLVELKSFGISSFLNNEFNLAYLAIVSDDFDSDIEVLSVADKISNTIKQLNGNNIIVESKFNPLHFPLLDKSLVMDDEELEKMSEFHPYTSQTIKIKSADDELATLRVISKPNTIDNNLH